MPNPEPPMKPSPSEFKTEDAPANMTGPGAIWPKPSTWASVLSPIMPPVGQQQNDALGAEATQRAADALCGSYGGPPITQGNNRGTYQTPGRSG